MQSAASFVVSAVAADTGVDTKCWMDGHEEEDTCTSGVSGVHARPLLETSRCGHLTSNYPLHANYLLQDYHGQTTLHDQAEDCATVYLSVNFCC